jgi:hypothetical protein
MPVKKIEFSTTTYKSKKLDIADDGVYQIDQQGNAFDLKGNLIKKVDVDLKHRDIEIDMLKQLANIAFSNAKEIKDAHCALDIFGQLENLTNEDTEIMIGDSDAIMLRDAFNKVAEKRPAAWLKAGAVIKQLI